MDIFQTNKYGNENHFFPFFCTGANLNAISDDEEEEEEIGFKVSKLEEISGSETDGVIEGINFFYRLIIF